MKDLTISTSIRGEYTILALDGELDLNSARRLRDRLLGICSGYGASIVLDLADLSFCDASGLNTILAAYRHVAQSRGSLSLVGPQERVALVLRITELDHCIPIFPTLFSATGVNPAPGKVPFRGITPRPTAA